jgi:hypothetical protein
MRNRVSYFGSEVSLYKGVLLEDAFVHGATETFEYALQEERQRQQAYELETSRMIISHSIANFELCDILTNAFHNPRTIVPDDCREFLDIKADFTSHGIDNIHCEAM